MAIKEDILNREDVELLVRRFYEKVRKDELIGAFFNEIVEIDWEAHFPIMFDFWETTLLGKMKYKGNPMTVHFDLNRKKALKPIHFDRWLELWKATINENFEGKIATHAIDRATNIGQLMSFKMQQQH